MITKKDFWGAVVIVIAANWAVFNWHSSTVSQQLTLMQNQVISLTNAAQNQISALNGSAEKMQEAVRTLSVATRELELTKKDKK